MILTCPPQRYVMSILCFAGLALTYIMRFCLGLVITEMVVPQHIAKPGHYDPDACPYDTSNSTAHLAKEGGEFHWSESTQGLILSSFFWGYVITQVPGGILADKFGGKLILGIGLAISSIGTLITPLAARTGGSAAFMAVRVVMGLGQGVIYPSLHVLAANWVPTEERGRLGSFIFAGANFGNVISMSLTGVMLGQFHAGWPVVFYVYGILGLGWLSIWYFLAYSTPLEHPSLSDHEAKYLRQYSQSVNINKESRDSTPWKDILTSIPLWALIIGQIGHDWGLFTIITDLPKYMKSVMHFTITENGLLLSLPYLLMWIVAIFSGYFVDWILRKQFFGRTTTRKIFTTVASVGPAVGIVGATYAGCNRSFATISFIIGMGFMGFFYPSLKVNALDLSPNYAGSLSALVMGIGAVSGILTPYLVGVLTPESTLLQWRLVFWISVGVLLGTNILYIIAGSGDVQPWNNPKKEKEERIIASHMHRGR
ncbi:putative inorganic phosphate cotransporter isoform X3 [Rhodnius prolixus]|uniref:putative inorganic phosphate cotransporter isoform X3 n=1 Tax=Rhodnius prolixus TaxID=13249 RepID=UPI003D18AD81